MSYIKKYEPGELKLDLPFANCIYELPLLSFVDMRSGIGLSLIYNRAMENDGSNPYNIAAGYKLNLQKRIFFSADGTGYFQESNGKTVLLYENPLSNGSYTFPDDSQRIIRIMTNGGYTLEYSDCSVEKYNSNGKITELRDKYNDKLLTYVYINEILSSVVYREGSLQKSISFTYDEAQRLTSISYSGSATTTIQLSYLTNTVAISHYSGVDYALVSTETTFTATISGLEGSKTYTYRKKCSASNDERTLILSDLDNDLEINKITYKFPDSVNNPKISHNQVEITDYLGAKTRVQFRSEKPTCSYEIGDDAVFHGDHYYGNITVYNTEDDLYNAQTSFVKRYDDGWLMNRNGNNAWSISTTGVGYPKGYYVLSGWIRTPLNNISPGSHTVTVSGSTGQYFEFCPNIVAAKQWVFFTYKFYMSAQTISASVSSSNTETRDFRLHFEQSHELSVDKKAQIPIAEDVLLNKETGSAIPLKDVFFSVEKEDTELDWCSFEDLLKYVLNKRKNTNTSEFYYSKCKTIVGINPSDSVTFTYNSQSYGLSNFYIGRRIYSKKGLITTRVMDDQSGCLLVYETLNENDIVVNSKRLNGFFDVISETNSEGVTTSYTRDKGLVTSTNVNGYFSTSTIYNENEGTIIATDEFGKQARYTLNQAFGTVESINLPDGTTITDDYDDDKSVLMSKTFTNNQESKINSFGYSGGYLTSLTGSEFNYGFDYSGGYLTKVSKNSSSIVECDHAKTYTTCYYPSAESAAYTMQQNYDKYGRVTNVAGCLTNTYDISPYSVSGTYYTEGVNNGSAKLAVSEDHLTGNLTKYAYEDDKLKDVYTFNSSGAKIGEDSLTYDSINRLKTHSCTYNFTSLDSVSGSISYKKQPTDLTADNLVYTYTYNVNGTRKAYSYNNYDSLNRLTGKSVTLNPQNIYFNKNITYDKTRVHTVTEDYSGSARNSDSFSYDNVGRITGIASTFAGANSSKSYTYDEFGRLSREDNKALDKTFVYSYNDNGTINLVERYAYSTGNPSGTPNRTEFVYSEDKLTGFDGKSISYNSFGGVSSYDGWSYSWNKGRLSSISKALSNASKAAIVPGIKSTKTFNFSYNGLGQRVGVSYNYFFGNSIISPVQPGEVTAYDKAFYYDQLGRLIAETNTKTLYGEGTKYSGIVYIYDESSMIGMVYTSGGTTQTYYYLRNLQGDVIGIYNTNGVLKVKYSYDAWGNCTVASETTDYALASANPIRYRGYYYDNDTGLYYLNARYYNPQWRRFISPDDTAYLDPETPNGLNLYAYCNNDPVNYADPSGCAPEWWQWALAGVAIAGAITVSVLTAGTAAPVLAGMLIGGAVSAGFEIGSQIKFDGGVHNIDAIISAALGGMVAGAISGIPLGGGFAISDYIITATLGGAGSLAGGLVSGGIHDKKSFWVALSLGVLGNVAAKAVNQLVVNLIARKMMNIPSAKGRSLAVNDYMIKHNVKPMGFEHSNFGGWSRNIFKNMSKKCLIPIVADTTNRYAIVYSAFISSSISGWY